MEIQKMIRLCQAGDLDTICRIAKAAWEKIFDHLEDAFGKELYNKVNPDCRNSKTPWLHKFFAEHPDWIYVAERNNKVVGFICIIMNFNSKVAQISNNAVDPFCGEKGVGQEMYQAVFERFKAEGMQAAMVTTGLDDAHAPARRAYERAGFKRKAEQVCYIMDLEKGE